MSQLTHSRARFALLIAVPLAALLTGVLVVAESTGPARPSRGAAALSDPVTSMPDLVARVHQATGSCTEAAPASVAELEQFVGPRLAGLYIPFVAEWSTCWVSPSYPKVGMVLLKDQTGFERSWRDAMTAGQVSDGPIVSFGNGFAVTAGFLGVSELDLYYLRCHYDDPQVHQVPADVDGCVFANPEHHHHG